MFFTFEGPDGSGKSTAIRAVADSLRREGWQVTTTRQPGDCSIGTELRRLLLEGQAVDPAAELFLYLADRAQNVAEVIRPALSQDHVVICDRYADSTVVYQGYARGMDLELLRRLNLLATGGLVPDRTLLLDVPPEVGLARQASKDRLDQEPLPFHQKVRDGFLAEASREPGRWIILDASGLPEAVAQACLTAVQSVL